MKFDPQKAFPYPVLRPHSDDYDGPEFQVNVEYASPEDSDVVDFDISYIISSDEIAKEVSNGNAVFVSLIACRDTYSRFVLTSRASKVTKSIDKTIIRGEVQILSYVIAKKPIDSFVSGDINGEFGEGPFAFSPGEVLAQDEPYVLYIDRDLFKPVTAVFDLVVDDKLERAEWNIAYGQEHIQIGLNPKMKEKIDSARNSNRNKAILLNSIYFSTVMEAVSQLNQDDCPYEDYKWAQVIRRQASNKHIDMSTQPLYKIATELMQRPLSHLDTYVFKETD